jgi:3'-5' exonuclease
MPHDRLLCLDIETIPDPDLVPAGWPAEKFVPNPMWHRVVAISFVEARLELNDGRERYPVACCRAGGEAGWDEPRLLQAWWRHFGGRKARVVTWNGRGFDLPVLRLRAMVHGLSAASWSQGPGKWDSYAQRYAPDWHCDLMEQISDYGACRNLGLQDVAVAVGLPGKIGGHGSEVAAMAARGEIARVRAYCGPDCLNLFALYIRWALLSGRTDAAGHDASLASLVRCPEDEREARPHLGEFLDRRRSPGPGRRQLFYKTTPARGLALWGQAGKQENSAKNLCCPRPSGWSSARRVRPGGASRPRAAAPPKRVSSPSQSPDDALSLRTGEDLVAESTSKTPGPFDPDDGY